MHHVRVFAHSVKGDVCNCVRVNCVRFSLLFVFEKRREESSSSFALHSQRLASLESHRVVSLSLLPLLLPLLHLFIDHQSHVLLRDERFKWGLNTFIVVKNAGRIIVYLSYLPGVQLLGQHHLVFDGVEKLYSH